MTWYLYASGRRMALAPGIEYRLGRAPDCDVVLSGERLSRTHLLLTAAEDDSGWQLRDRSSNGSFSSQGRVRSVAGDQQLALALGSPTGPVIVVSREPRLAHEEIRALAHGIAPGEHVTLGDTPAEPGAPGGQVRLGRAPDNDIVLPSLLASEHHALVLSGPAGWELLDLNSARGTFVQGERVRRAPLTDGDVVSLGGSSFTFRRGRLEPRGARGGVPVEACAITVRTGSAVLIHEVSFRAEPRTVTAVIGPSGSGKSTLLNALTGLRPAQSGRVLIDGGDFYSRYEEMRFWVGAVPQADLVPAQLRVREALEFAARLRFPKDTPADARRARVSEVLEELGLADRGDLRIDRLSGGQRKRVSVALELLTRPQILFLDEPTSGLDPGLDRQVMMLLRELADDGRTVFVVTHAVENLTLADRLIVLAAGGWLAYDGPPQEVLAHFQVPDMPAVFTTLEATPGHEWAVRWSRHRPVRGTGAAGDGTRAEDSEATRAGHGSGPLALAKPVGGLSQLSTLVLRNLRTILADPGYVGLLVLLPVILGLAGALVGSRDGLGPGSSPGGLNPEARSLLLVIALGCVFTGAATSIQELVKERVIYQRERAVGLSAAAYVASKGLVLGTIAAVQGFAYALITLAGRPGPAAPLVLPAHLEIAAVASLATVCAAMTGLAISAVLPSREMAMPVLVVLTISEVILSGAIPLRVDWVVDTVGWAMAAHWQFSAMASSIDLAALLGPAAAGATWPHAASGYLTAAAVLLAMSAGMLILAIALNRRHDPGRA